MHITQLTLTRYRGGRALLLDLNERLNVFVGMNGAGKSSVLDATAILLSWFVNRMKHSGASGRPITETDIQNGTPSAILALSCYCDARKFEWSLAKSRKGHSQEEHSSLQQLSEFAKQFQDEITTSNRNVNLPLFAYYPVNRAVLDIPLRIKEKHSFDLLSAYDESLTSGANFRTFFEWFREREDLENENRKYVDQHVKPEGYQFPDPQLEAVRSALDARVQQSDGTT